MLVIGVTSEEQLDKLIKMSVAVTISMVTRVFFSQKDKDLNKNGHTGS